jgi:hypothetical protein
VAKSKRSFFLKSVAFNSPVPLPSSRVVVLVLPFVLHSVPLLLVILSLLILDAPALPVLDVPLPEVMPCNALLPMPESDAVAGPLALSLPLLIGYVMKKS